MRGFSNDQTINSSACIPFFSVGMISANPPELPIVSIHQIALGRQPVHSLILEIHLADNMPIEPSFSRTQDDYIIILQVKVA
jgi:hypothetical protein